MLGYDLAREQLGSGSMRSHVPGASGFAGVAQESMEIEAKTPQAYAFNMSLMPYYVCIMCMIYVYTYIYIHIDR